MHDVVAEQGAHAALEHEAVLVFAGVPVQRGSQVPGRYRMLDEREVPAGVLGPRHEPDANRTQVDRLPVTGADDPGPLRAIESLGVGGTHVPTLPGKYPPRMRIDEILERLDRPVFSFEFFPPKTDEGIEELRTTLDALRNHQPRLRLRDLLRAGTTRDRTQDIVEWIERELDIEAVSHFTCVGATRAELTAILARRGPAGVRERARAPR